MSDLTISIQDIITLAAVIGAIGGIYAIVSKPFKTMREVKDALKDLTESVSDIKETVDMQGDMVYQLLNHAATNNNTGGMQEALDKYNAWYRH